MPLNESCSQDLNYNHILTTFGNQITALKSFKKNKSLYAF